MLTFGIAQDKLAHTNGCQTLQINHLSVRPEQRHRRAPKEFSDSQSFPSIAETKDLGAARTPGPVCSSDVARRSKAGN
jgi:hypothetical protein